MLNPDECAAALVAKEVATITFISARHKGFADKLLVKKLSELRIEAPPINPC